VIGSMNKEDFDYNDFSWDMVQSENKFYGKNMAEKKIIEVAFLGGEVLTGKIKWYDELNLGILNEQGEEIYIDKRSVKWLRTLP
jgi:hypothetical protein